MGRCRQATQTAWLDSGGRGGEGRPTGGQEDHSECPWTLKRHHASLGPGLLGATCIAGAHFSGAPTHRVRDKTPEIWGWSASSSQHTSGPGKANVGSTASCSSALLTGPPPCGTPRSPTVVSVSGADPQCGGAGRALERTWEVSLEQGSANDSLGSRPGAVWVSTRGRDPSHGHGLSSVHGTFPMRPKC